ncbi:hypothetical protein EYF80_058739 [Liparis tanakae]|uniref:Uncharacterized protein n=1 Tax=Liparis tanakae TaxID=230148 RepID=A0A4Z2ER76_9TELE|nr:hypothetical protein EYF80_058739 [Liparis tanakae]
MRTHESTTASVASVPLMRSAGVCVCRPSPTRRSEVRGQYHHGAVLGAAGDDVVVVGAPVDVQHRAGTRLPGLGASGVSTSPLRLPFRHAAQTPARHRPGSAAPHIPHLGGAARVSNVARPLRGAMASRPPWTGGTAREEGRDTRERTCGDSYLWRLVPVETRTCGDSCVFVFNEASSNTRSACSERRRAGDTPPSRGATSLWQRRAGPAQR